MKLIVLLSFLAASIYVNSQTTINQKVANYKDNNTPYPLYAGSFGMKLQFTDSDINILAKNFDALYGAWDINMEIANNIRKQNSDFDFQAYKGNWRVSGKSLEYVEDGNLEEILYYRVGNLSANINATDKEIEIEDIYGSIVPSTAHADSSKSYHFDKTNYYITFLKIGNEYLRIIDTNGSHITLERGFSDTKAADYTKGTVVLAPVYGRPPSSNRKYEYRQDERSMLRWKYFMRNIISEYHRHGGGIWIDILIGNLAHYTLSGETVPPERIWDLERNTVYDPIERAKNAERGIKYIQDMFYTIYDTYPVIWGNNMMFPITEKNDRLRMLLQTDKKPRPIDGFAMENCFAQYGYGGHSGKKFMYTSYEDWQLSLQSIMYMGELKVSARPLIMDGGIDNKKFASLPKERRHELFLYGYASYLLGVKVEDDGKIYTMFGLCPFVFQEDGNHYAELDPCFLWDIGKPVETHASKDYLKYKMKNRNVFIRKFENGIVLVNPSDNTEEDISLKNFGNYFINPDKPEEKVKKVNIPAKNGLILFYE